MADLVGPQLESIRTVPIQIFHGDADDTVPVDQSRQIAAALQRSAADVQYTEYAGVDHGGAAERAIPASSPGSWGNDEVRKAPFRVHTERFRGGETTMRRRGS